MQLTSPATDWCSLGLNRPLFAVRSTPLARLPEGSGITNRGSRQSSQEVCPFNRRHTQGNPASAPSLVELMRMTQDDWDRWTRGSAIRRAGYAGFRRNVAVALGNWLAAGEESDEAVSALRAALTDDEPLVREHAAWALDRIGSTARAEP